METKTVAVSEPPGWGDDMPDINPYWQNIDAIASAQRKKGLKTYGQGLEKNPADIITRLTAIEEELVDALMYIEWAKDYLNRLGDDLK